MKIQDMDTPMLRQHFVEVRTQAVKLVPGSFNNKDFNNHIFEIIKNKMVSPTPKNIVLVAEEFLESVRIEAQNEEENQAFDAHSKERELWEDAMERQFSAMHEEKGY